MADRVGRRAIGARAEDGPGSSHGGVPTSTLGQTHDGHGNGTGPVARTSAVAPSEPRPSPFVVPLVIPSSVHARVVLSIRWTRAPIVQRKKGTAFVVASATLVLLFTGCTDAPPPDGPPTGRPALSFGAPLRLPDALCRSFFCFEPSVAVDGAGRILVTAAQEAAIAVSDDEGRTFRLVDRPGAVRPGADYMADALLVAGHDTTVFYLGLVGVGLDMRALGSPHASVLGIQVAATTDGGTTWDSNVLLSLEENAQGADRPWLVDGPDGVVVSYSQTRAHEVRVAWSSDGGRTFSPGASVPVGPRVEVGAAGPIVAAGTEGAARYALALAERPTPMNAPSLRVYMGGGPAPDLTPDPAAPGTSAAAAYWPAATATPEGAWALAWRDGDSALWLSQRADGWSEPVAVAEEAVLAPWIGATGGSVDVAWYAPAATGGASLWFGRLGTAADSKPIERVQLADDVRLGTGRSTDFAHAAYLPDGRAVVAWSREGAAFVAVEDRNGPVGLT